MSRRAAARDTKVPVPLYRVGRDGVREPLPVEIANPTSLALGPDGADLRLEPVRRPRLSADARRSASSCYATELGVPTGLAFAPDGTLFVGDRSGSILRVSPDRQVETFATLPSSVAAFHLAFGPDDCLYVTAPTLATHDALYRITPDRLVDDGVRRVRAAAGTGVRLDAARSTSSTRWPARRGCTASTCASGRPSPVLVLSAPALIGVAFDPARRRRARVERHGLAAGCAAQPPLDSCAE